MGIIFDSEGNFYEISCINRRYACSEFDEVIDIRTGKFIEVDKDSELITLIKNEIENGVETEIIHKLPIKVFIYSCRVDSIEKVKKKFGCKYEFYSGGDLKTKPLMCCF